MGRALDYAVAVMALARVREDVCHCEKMRVGCADCPVADAYDALGRLVASDPTFDPRKMAAAVFRREETGDAGEGG